MGNENAKMLECILYNSKKGGHYFINPANKTNLLFHPLMVYFYNNLLSIDNTNYKLPSSIIIDKIKYKENEIVYYYSKYKYLSSNKVFDSSINKLRYSGKINSLTIISEISNLKNIVFELTEQCNLNCTYCGYGLLYKNNIEKRDGQNLSFLTIKTIFDYLSKYWGSEFNTSKMQAIDVGFYGGEPLLRFDLIAETINYIEDKNIPCRQFTYRMTTNGVLLNKYIDEIVKYKIHLSVSIDGDEVNHSYRVNHKEKNSFITVFNNLKLIQSKYPQYFRDYVEFMSVIHNRNSIKSTNDFLYKEFKKHPMLLPLNTTGINETNIALFNKLYNNISEEKVSTNMIESKFTRLPSVRNLSDYLVYHSTLFYRNYQDLFLNQQDVIRIPTGTCLPFTKKLFITSTGKILACEKISNDYELGSITDGEVVLNSDYIATQFNNYIESMRKLCNVCYYADYCFQCLYQMDKTGEGKLLCKQRSKNELRQYYATIFSFLEENPQLVDRIYEEVVIT